MSLKIEGTITKILPLESGQSARGGTWQKQGVVIETSDKYPKTICLTLWGDVIDDNDLNEGDLITAHINIESREYNGKYYTDVRAWKIEGGASEPAQTSKPKPAPTATSKSIVEQALETDDELPF